MPSLFGALSQFFFGLWNWIKWLSRLPSFLSHTAYHLNFSSPSHLIRTQGDISMTPLPVTSGQPEQEAEGKVRKLKRRFVELEEETKSEALLSSDRNVRMREERKNSDDKVQELENGQSHSNGFPVVGSTSPVVPMAQLRGDDKDWDVQKSDRGEGSHSANGGPPIMDYSPQPQDRDHFPVPISNSDHHIASPTSASSRGHHPPSSHSTSPSHHQSHMQPDNDVNMNDATVSGNSLTPSNNSRHLSAARGSSQKAQGHDLRGADASVPGPSTRAKGTEAGPLRRSNRQSKGHFEPVSRTTRSGSSAIAAAAAEAAEAEAEAATARQQVSPRITNDLDVQQGLQMTNNITVATSANPSSKNSNNNNPPTKSAGTISPTSFVSRSHVPLPESTPSMENIIKVAAAAVAAQNAAASAAANAKFSSPSQSHQIVDPNLDPSLFSNKGGVASRKIPAVDTKATASGPNSATNPATTPSTTTPTSSLSSNPYLSLSMFARQNSGSTTPTGHPMLPMHSNPMYYSPNTPVTPNTSSYPMYGNPYYYLAGPMAPGSNGMFPPLSPGTVPPPPPPAQRPPAEPPIAKPKRLKTHTVTTRSFSIPMVPRDKKGKPMLPLNVGIMTVINLGEVCMREPFHTERYIFPVGYEVTRRYLSTINPAIEVVYHCTILDGGDGPKFQIIPSDRADKPIIAGTATGAWSNIVKQANAIRNRQHSNSVSGPDFFGLGQNTIKHLIQELPNSDRLRDYVWQNFVEGGPLGGRHAAVIPALPEEYDASMPIGAYYPKREVSANPGVPRGLSHYPQHIIAQAEAQKSQQLATRQAKESGASAGPSSSSSSLHQGGSTLSQNATQHVQTALPPAGSSLNIQHYQPTQQVQGPSQGPGKRATRSSTNANANTSASSGPGRSTRASTRGSQRRAQQQQQQPVSASAPGNSVPSASEAMPTTFVAIMSQFPVPGLADTSHPAGS